MKILKKIVAILAVALMLCSILPLSVFAAESTVSYDFSTFSGSSTQYAQQSHDLGNGLNVSMVGCHINTQLRFYNSQSSVEAIFNVTDKEITSMTLNAGYKAGNMTVSTSADGATWSDAGSITTTTSYTNYTVNFDPSTKYVKLGKGTGTSQIRIKTVSFTVVDAAGGEEPPATCEHEWELISTTPANCTTAGEEYYECSACGESKTEAIEALGHSYGEAVQTQAPDCTNAGEQESTCTVCGDVKTETVKALGHNYVDGFCDVCGEAEPLEVTIEVFANTGILDGTASISWTNGNFQFTTYKANSSSAIRTSDADHFRIYAHNKVVVSALNGEKMTKVQFIATSPSYASVLGGCTAEGWTASVDDSVVTFTATSGAAESLTIEDVSAQTRVNGVIITPYVEIPSDCEHDYVGVETQAPTCSVPGVMTYTCSLCGDEYTEAIATIPHSYVEEIIDSTCTTTGTATYECSVCFDSYDETIPMKPHNYVDDVCDACGAVKAYKGTITFDADKTQRVEFTTQIQIWENESLNVTNNKASSTTNIGDYAGRFYKNSEIIISFPEMSKLIIDASSINEDYLWDATLDGYTYTVADGIYTITFAEPVNSITLTAANQVRANSITAIVAHECVWADATCTAPKTCSKCGATEGEALGHAYFYPCDPVCMNCHELTNPEAAHSVLHVEALDPTCTALGNVEYWYCSDCGTAWLDETCTQVTNPMSVKLPMAEHEYFYPCDPVCMNCYEITNPEAAHSITTVEAVEATCTANGNIAYWYCSDCGTAWADEALSQQTNRFNVVVPATGEHIYDNAFDTDCDVCGAIRDVVNPIAFGGNSRSDDVSGLAFKFDVAVDGMMVNGTTAIYDEATINGYKLIKMGAIVSNAKSELNIEAKYLCDLEPDSASFAVRVINIPEANYGDVITAIPYYIVEIDGVATTIYGEAQDASYNG